jgi:uncharacterized protein (DUF58 family)
MKIRLSKKLLLAIVLAVVVAGLAYLIIGLLYVPQLSQFEATGELAKTDYFVGEEITVEPFLTYTGMRRVTISSARPLLFLDVYTAENARVLELPVLTQLIQQYHTLRPSVHYNEKDRWHGFTAFPADYLKLYAFSLQQPGSYYVVVRAEFRLDKDDRSSASRVCSEPIWVQITG